MFLATFLIALREGLEASLIVGILAAFLKKRKCSLTPLILATVAAILISIAVGVGLMLASQALPQAQQEALETVIGAVAIVFVTTMILWMNTNARAMSKNLTTQAEQTMSKGGAAAMAGMAFLSVLKEGFETAVFLIALLQSATGNGMEMGLIGAVVGFVLACAIGVGIYYGGSRFNIGTFFKVTGPFLILVAAGFVANVFRTAHEAGWVNIGQTQVFDFSAVISNDSVIGALLTGMFSIQADPRLIEVIAWFAYLVPVMLVYLWPAKWSFALKRRMRFKQGWACALVAAAVLMFALVPHGNVANCAGATRAIEGASNGATSITLVSQTADQAVVEIAFEDGSTLEGALSYVDKGEDMDGNPLINWSGTVEMEPSADLPTSDVTLNDLVALAGKLPSGVNKERNPGPFDIDWSQTLTIDIRTSYDNLLRASCTGRLTATLSGGGIDGTKTVNMSRAISESWSVSDEETSAAESALQAEARSSAELVLWWAWIPCALAGVAVCLLVSSLFDSRKLKQEVAAPQAA